MAALIIRTYVFVLARISPLKCEEQTHTNLHLYREEMNGSREGEVVDIFPP